ncbi:MAG: DEAD/DEAH box helicase [Candidatus Binatia bacterium]|nr:DEAD/DEAH box helicase [Candidatus Binatia bacterium]
MAPDRYIMRGLGFDPLLEGWFVDRFGEATPPQALGWKAIAAGQDTLISAPTGSGKTLAAFLWAMNGLVESARNDALESTTILYISPLKALGNDIEKNLAIPLRAVRERAETAGIPLQDIRVSVRSGDTPASERQAMLRRPPHILITTPESLYILLTAAKSREMLRTVKTVIVDEIHAVAGDKRGAHLALTLERLDQLVGHRPQRIGLSATQKPIEKVAGLLVGAGRTRKDGTPDCEIIDTGHRRAMELRIETPDMELGAIATHELRASIYDRIAQLVATHETTIIFVNTRRLVERVAHDLGERIGADRIVAHHGSLSRRSRLAAEEKLKSGDVPVVVATASLELGIDVGHVDLVCHLGAPRALATLLQRVGRSGHWLGSVPRGVFFPLTRDEMLQTAAAVRAIRTGELDQILMPNAPLDILAQQMVASIAAEEMGVDELYGLVRRAHPYRDLSRENFDRVLEMLVEGISTSHGRRAAHLHHDRVNQQLKPRRGARLASITGGGAIPDTADYAVIEDPTGARVGTVNEDFAIESMRGDIFLLGNHSWRIRRVESGTVRVEDAGQAPPTIPFWLGEAPARTRELSEAVSTLREDTATRLIDRDAAVTWLMSECGIDRGGAEQIVEYVAATVAMLGTVPTCERIIAERFFDESGGMQLVIHSPFGGAVNRALGLALRKNFCVNFDFELQAAATDDGVVISLGEQHSFPLPSVFTMVRPDKLEADLIQAALAAPMFGNRWRWNVTRSLALARHSGGKRVPMNIQRMRAEDLLAAVFPAQLGCGDNRTGPIQAPEHPLVDETLDNCLHEAMDTEGLRAILEKMRSGEIRTVAVETSSPSPMAHELLNAYPYAFLDDAPLEERRARAVNLRRTDSSIASGIGALDPAAIAEVREQAWPDVRDADELHDALHGFVWLPRETLRQNPPWLAWMDELAAAGRVTIARWTAEGDTAPREAFVAAERIEFVRLALPDATLDPAMDAPTGSPVAPEAETAVQTALRGWLSAQSPTTAASLSATLGLRPTTIEAGLAQLENDGFAMRGTFSPGATGEEWCERRLLARIHRLTLGILRREIEPVSVSNLIRFQLRWQHVSPRTQLHGREGLAMIIEQLHGIEAPAPAWEGSILPARIEAYAPNLLDELCFSGEVAWGRFSPPNPNPNRGTRRPSAPTRNAPLGLALREDLPALLAGRAAPDTSQLSGDAKAALAALERDGASFLGDIARSASLLPTSAEGALWELVARGMVTGDGFAGLRTLLTPEEKRRSDRRLRSVRGGRGRNRRLPVGRWATLLHRDVTTPLDEEEHAEWAADLLLRRYGVVFREVTARESLMPPWRMLLAALRRLEARGEIRGGRFVEGIIGEQFASPAAVEALRATRREDGGEVVLISSADPLNLVGILTPGARVAPQSGQVIAFADGVPIECGDLGHVRSRLAAQGKAESLR